MDEGCSAPSAPPISSSKPQFSLHSLRHDWTCRFFVIDGFSSIPGKSLQTVHSLQHRGTACSSMKRESWVGSTNRRSAFCSSNFPLGGGLQCCRPSSSSSSPSSPSSRFSAAAAQSPASLAHMTFDNYKK